MINYEEYIEKINKCFEGKNEILGSDLKVSLGMEKSGTAWGSLLAALISKKILMKIDDKFERVNSKITYYYKLAPTFNQKNKKDTKNYIIYDQNGNIYDYPSDDLIDDTLISLITNNSQLELHIYKKTKVVKAELKIITKELRG